MTRRGRTVLGAVLALVLVLGAAGSYVAYRFTQRRDRTTTAELRAQVAALEQERNVLKERRAQLMVRDERLRTMPDTPVRVGVPTDLAETLIRKVLAEFADQVTVELKNIRTRKAGTIRKVVTLGDYDLRIVVTRATGRLKPGTPNLTFGGDSVGLDLPVSVSAGTGHAKLDFTWNGRSVAGAVCGDMAISREINGRVLPASYRVSGTLGLTATATQVLVSPRLQPLSIVLKVEPSELAWAEVKKILDDKSGMCGFVLDHVDILGAIRDLVDKGFKVRIPVEKIRAAALPVGIDPVVTVGGRRVMLAIKVGQLSISPHTIWLGAQVRVGGGS